MAIESDASTKQGLRISGQLLARNAALNFVGQAVPILTALFSMPYIVRGLGVERFGILSLAWAAIAYFSYFDLGVTRATIKFTADAIGRERIDDLAPTVWTSLVMQTAFGLTSALTLVAATPGLVRLLHIPPLLQPESRQMFQYLAWALPIVLWLGTLKGVLEAGQRFDAVNLVRIFSNSLMFIAPALGVAFGYRLRQIGLLLVAILLLTTGAYLLLALRIFPVLRERIIVLRSAAWPLLRYGRWVMASSALVPAIIYSDRLFIALSVSVAAVGFYAGAYEIASRLQVIPWSFVTTLFPAFSSVTAVERHQPRSLYARSLKYLLLIMGPLALVVTVFARDILGLWLGAEFAQHSTSVLQILAVGMLLNALSQVPASALDGIGRPDLRAKVFALYLPLYLLALWMLVHSMGIVGAALAWAVRGAVEFALFFAVVWRSLRLTQAMFADYGLHRSLAAVILLAGASGMFGSAAALALWSRGALVGVLLPVFFIAVWRFVLDEVDRSAPRALFASGLKIIGRG